MGFSRAASALIFGLLCAAFPVAAQIAPVGPEFQVNTFTPDFQLYPSVAGAADGDFVIVWASYDQDGSYGGIFGQRYDREGARLGSEFRVNTTVEDDQYFPSVASDAEGNFVVVWTSYYQDGDYLGVFGQRFSSEGVRIGGEFQVNSFTIGYQGLPEVASAPDGRFIVVWASQDQDGSDFGVFGQLYDAAGAPVSGEFQVNSETAEYQGGPAVAMDGGGDFVVVWTSYGQDGDGYGIFGQRYDSSGAPLGGEFQANTYTLDDQIDPDVATDEAGNFIVVWQSDFQDGSGNGIFGQRFAADGTRQGSEFQVNEVTVGDQGAPAVAGDPTGRFLVTWVDDGLDGDDLGVFGRQFDPSGEPAGPQFQVNSTTARSQTYQAVAAAGAGRFIVAWSSLDQDGSGFGVFGQRFTADGAPLCPGDCDGDGAVTVAELIRGVNIALGNAPLGDCPAFDTSGDGSVTVSELIQSVNAALSGCP